MIKNMAVLGLFGGASLNSAELALVNTDGIDIHNVIKTSVVPYPEPLVWNIRSVIGHRFPDLSSLRENRQIQQLQAYMTDFYVEAVNDFCSPDEIDEIGIDSLTICHDAANKCSYQLEQGHELSRKLNRRIVTHFHKADLLSGGQASPLTPAFFNAVGQKIEKPALFIDLETVSSLVYLGESGELLAFDCAPGLAMIEDWTFRHANMQTDYNGRLAITGKIHTQILESLLHHKILRKTPPKSLDILCFADKKEHLEGLSLEDGAATATAFIAQAVYQAAQNFLPQQPQQIYVAGEGLKNPSLMRFLKHIFNRHTLIPVTDLSPQLTMTGAVSTAYNAARRLYSLPITYPTTTGAYEPMTGGEIYDEK
ncbi:MAG: anhydro-N-acetylmuramic acid kinase [Pseudomonadota bacterium]|nr:anhydro-N-acetylmuramic acid kinase [Pseudomonadota bacterium]